MKAITIKQPWSALIVQGIKDIENRSWPTKYRGRVLIHASASPVRRPKYAPIAFPYTLEQESELSSKGIYAAFGKLKIPQINGAIIGSVEIIDCVINHPSVWAEKTPDCANGGCSKCSVTGYCPETGNHLATEPFKPIYNWVLANPILFETPIENVKGKLSFWEYEIDKP